MLPGSQGVINGGRLRRSSMGTSLDIRAYCLGYSSAQRCRYPAPPTTTVSAAFSAAALREVSAKVGFPSNSGRTAAKLLFASISARRHQWISKQSGSARALCEWQEDGLAIDSTSEDEVTESQYHWRVRFDALVEFQMEHGHCDVPQNYEKNRKLGMWVNDQRVAQAEGKLAPERKRQLDDLDFVWSKSTDEMWEVMFRQLQEFKEAHGHCDVPRRNKENPKLGTWVNTQRTAKCKGKLAPERERRLDDLGFVWSKSKDERWEKMFRQLGDFQMEHGHCSVPLRYKENPKLGKWVNDQRAAHAKGKLAPERKRRLDDLGFVWSMSTDEMWEVMFRQLQEFKEAHGHCDVPRRNKENPKLGTWVNTQRMAKCKGKLAPERERRLDDLGFVWSKSKDERWEEMFRQLGDFQMEHGHCSVPFWYKENPKLGKWVYDQRVAQAEGKLAPERKRRLDYLGFVWSKVKSNYDMWEERYEQLEEFQMEHGHCNVPKWYKKFPKLRMWVQTQRVNKAGNRLDVERERRLDGLGVVWSKSKDERWEKMYRQLQDFRMGHGHCRVLKGYKKFPELREWMENQRTFKDEGQLAFERERRLDDLGFVWRKSRDERWEEMYRQLKEFKEAHGHCNVPKRYKKSRYKKTPML